MEQSIQFLKIIGKENLVKAANIATLKMFASYKEVETPAEPVPTEKASTIAKLIKKSDFGCQKTNVAKLCEILTGEKIIDLIIEENDIKSEQEFLYVLFACFVVKKELDICSVGEICMIVDTNGYGITIEGLKFEGFKSGNIHQYNLEAYNEEEIKDSRVNSTYLRPATSEEINTYLEELFTILDPSE
jgi:hypothetical protein